MKKYVIVTGAYGGMGRSTVSALKNAAFSVFALDKEVMPKEDDIFPIKADITKEEDIISAYETVKSITDEIYAIIHFAGIYMLDSLVEMTSEKFQKIFDINVKGAFFVNKTFISMLKKDSKILITTSELAPLDPLPFTGIYAITKSTLDKYAYSLRMELQLKDISVSVLRAGATDTGMLGASQSALDDFCERTELYSLSATKFKKIVNSVESRCVGCEKIAKKALKIISKRKPGFSYSINRNPLLLMLNLLPKKLQFFIIKKILK